MSDTPETDEARMKGYGEFGGDWSPLERNCYEKHPEGDVVFCEVAEKLERERDEARRDLVALEELHRRRFGTLRKELAASNRGAKINAHINNSLCSKVIQAERERDEARRLASVWEKLALREASINGAKLCAEEEE